MATALLTVVLVFVVASTCVGLESSNHRRPEEYMSGRHRKLDPVLEEARLIEPIKMRFIQDPDGFGQPGQGISLQALGEPKSGTTWLGRIVPHLALELCGSFNNVWCQLGGMKVFPNLPAPFYDFEMLTKTANERPTLFLHYKVGVVVLFPSV